MECDIPFVRTLNSNTGLKDISNKNQPIDFFVCERTIKIILNHENYMDRI